jgi:hypothetical protein
MNESFLGERDDTIKTTPKRSITSFNWTNYRSLNELIYNIWNNVGFKEATSTCKISDLS